MDPADFPAFFIAGWDTPTPDGFIAHFKPLAHPDVTASQPMLPTVHGPDAYMESFRQVFALMPDFRPQVLRWAIDGNVVYIESIATATLSGKSIRLEIVDRFTFKDGLIFDRTAFFDPSPIVAAVSLRPWNLPRFLNAVRTLKSS